MAFYVIVKTRWFVAFYLHSPGQVTASSDYVDVEDNQFTCNCLKVGWLLALATSGLNSRALGSEKQSDGTVPFLQQLVARAGPCLECAGAECRDAADRVTLAQFAAAALETDAATAGGAVRCAGSGLVIRNYDDTVATGAGAGRASSCRPTCGGRARSRRPAARRAAAAAAWPRRCGARRVAAARRGTGTGTRGSSI